MDQKTALRLLAEGAFFIFLDVPEGTQFGIDMKSWNTGERFRGVKMIPPGIHFIFYNSSNSTTLDIGPRMGFFHEFKKGEVLVRKFDVRTEQMSLECVSEEDIVKIKDNLAAFDGFLGPYPYDILDKWKNLCSHISLELVNKLMPKSGQIKAALELQSCSDADRPRGLLSKPRVKRSPDDTDLLPCLKPVEGTETQFTAFPMKNFPDGSSPSQITQHSLDLTFVFETLLQQYPRELDILGEVQFSYISFLVGQSFEAFDQWKRLVTLFCSCDLAVSKYRKLFDFFISVLQVQIEEIPEEFLADIVSNDNFVYVNLRKFFRTMLGVNVDGQLKTKVERFKDSLSDSYLWDFEHLESEDEDELPVVVEL